MPGADDFQADDFTPDQTPTGPADPMAAANVRIALANDVPRPANPIPTQDASSFDPSTFALTAGKLASDFATQTGKSIWDTSLGSIQNVYNRGTGPAITPQQLEAQARLHGAAKNAVANYVMGAAGEPDFAGLKRTPNMTGRLLNASGDVSPETLQNLKQVQPTLEAAGPPAVKTQAGMAQHLTEQSMKIQNQIAPIIQQNAAKDVSATTSQIAADLRSQITPAMQRTNPGIANTLERYAKGAEGSKTLGELDDFRQQLEQRRNALKPGSIGKPYAQNALNSVLDGIADHVQQVRPDMDVRSLRSTQKSLMQLSSTFEEAGAKGEAQAASQAGLTPRQKLAQLFPSAIEAATNRKAFIARQFAKPATAEELIQRAYAGQSQPVVGSMARSMAPEAQGMSEENLNAIRQGGEATRRSNAEFVQDIIRRQGLPVDPHMADVEAALKQRAAEFARQGEQVGGFPLKSQTPTTTSSEDIPPSESYYDKYGRPK